ATAAGVSRPTLYAHFPTREDLVEATVKRTLTEVQQEIAAADIGEGPAGEALERLISTGWRALARHLAIARLPLDPLPPRPPPRAPAPGPPGGSAPAPPPPGPRPARRRVPRRPASGMDGHRSVRPPARRSRRRDQRAHPGTVRREAHTRLRVRRVPANPVR